MEICILMGSPRKNGNTVALTEPFVRRMEQEGHTCRMIWLYEKELRPCIACRQCQKDWSIFGCPQQDDMEEIFVRIQESNLVILATPIYSWYCTPPMKSVLDRLVYGMNKYYGEEKGPSLWKGKKVALILTCGYPPEKGADLFEEGIRRYCKHSQLIYLGMTAARHMGYQTVFMDTEKERQAAAFAEKILEAMKK